jgi:hypothetical protein
LSAPKKKHKRSLDQRKRALNVAAGYVAARSNLSEDEVVALLAPHLNDPYALLAKLGVVPTQRHHEGSFAGIMTRPCMKKGSSARYQISG